MEGCAIAPLAGLDCSYVVWAARALFVLVALAVIWGARRASAAASKRRNTAIAAGVFVAILLFVNIDATVRLARAVKIPIIASGGLSNLGDIDALCEVEGEGIEGVICGRAIYSGDLDFSAAQTRADSLRESDDA